MSTRSARIVVVSSRAAPVYTDDCGPIIAGWLEQHGFSSVQPQVVADGNPVGEALHDAVNAGVDVIITSGGTGISPTDTTPEHTVAVLDYVIPGWPTRSAAPACPRCRHRCCRAGCAAWLGGP